MGCIHVGHSSRALVGNNGLTKRPQSGQETEFLMRRILALVLVSFGLLTQSASGQDVPFMPFQWTVQLTGPGSGAQVLPGHQVALPYRGFLVNKEPWKGGSLKSQWKPSEPTKGADNRLYGDRACFFVGTGAIREERSYEPLDGLIVSIDSASGNCHLLVPIDGGKDFKRLGGIDGKKPFSADWHTITIVDTIGSMSVLVDNELVIDAKIDKEFRTGETWGFFTREPNAQGWKPSLFRNIAWRAKNE